MRKSRKSRFCEAAFSLHNDWLYIYDNTVGAICNSPSYDWHLTNLRNYVKLSPNNRHGISLNDEKFSSLGEGTGKIAVLKTMLSDIKTTRLSIRITLLMFFFLVQQHYVKTFQKVKWNSCALWLAND
ncbi:MAG: linear amide C-N hydrolase [Flavobacteriaceae bacterium]|nr:linear amide C-N hydrolase [Flavobacteriaceae bacterium]